MTATPDIENLARIGRVTCGSRLPHLNLAQVRRFWRDVHSPAIARRAGIHEYRHNQFAPVRADLFAHTAGIAYACDPDAQLQWQSDVRYADDAALAAFGASPPAQVKAHLLSDIDMLVDRSTTYLVLGDNGRTLRDDTGTDAPQGPVAAPSFGVFLRQRGADQTGFRAAMRDMAARWAATDGVLRLRLSLFETPDMEAERAAGYPIKTHPPDQQYQAWIDLVLTEDAIARHLHPAAAEPHIAAIHAYPADNVYTFNVAGHPTLVGLRGFCAWEAIGMFDAAQHRQPALLDWMYAKDVSP